MSVYDDMARDGGFEGDEAKQVAAQIEQEHRESVEAPACPECGVSDGFAPVGPFRSQCIVCGALLKNAEVGR